VDHVIHHPFHKQVGVAAFEVHPGQGFGNGAAPPQVLPQEQGVDLGRVPPDEDVLIRKREDLGLEKERIAQEFRERQGFLHIIEVVAFQGFRIMVIGPLDLFASDIGPVLLGQPEVHGGRFQPVTFQFAGGDIVVLKQEEGVHHVSSENIHAGEVNDALRHRETGFPEPGLTAVPAPGQFDAMPAGSGDEVLEIKIEEVVAFEDVRVELGNPFAKGNEHLLFIKLPAEEDLFVAMVIPEGDGEDAVFLSQRVREFEPRRTIRFDIDGQAVQVMEGQALEEGFPGEEQKLLNRIGEVEIGRRGRGGCFAGGLAQMVARFLKTCPVLEQHQAGEGVGRVKRVARERLLEAVKEFISFQQQERAESFVFVHQSLRTSPEKPHHLPGNGLHGHDARGRIGSKQDFVAGDGQGFGHDDLPVLRSGELTDSHPVSSSPKTSTWFRTSAMPSQSASRDSVVSSMTNGSCIGAIQIRTTQPSSPDAARRLQRIFDGSCSSRPWRSTC